MKSRTKVQQVPTVLLDNVLAITLNKSKKKKEPRVPTGSRKVVIYKMISTEDWKKKEEARIAEEARIKVCRETPKSGRSVYYLQNSLKPKKKTVTSTAKQLKYAKEYYFKNKERLKQYQIDYYKKYAERITLTKPQVPPTDAK